MAFSARGTTDCGSANEQSLYTEETEGIQASDEATTITLLLVRYAEINSFDGKGGNEGVVVYKE